MKMGRREEVIERQTSCFELGKQHREYIARVANEILSARRRQGVGKPRRLATKAKHASHSRALRQIIEEHERWSKEHQEPAE